MQRYPPHYHMMEPGDHHQEHAVTEEGEIRYNNVQGAGSLSFQSIQGAADSTLLPKKGSGTKRVEPSEHPDDLLERQLEASSEDMESVDDGVDGRLPQRKKVSEMSPDKRLEWSRMQSRDHSRRSRQRRKKVEEDLRHEVEQLKSFRTLIEESSNQLVSIQSVHPKAQFLYANSVWFRALNYVPQELIGASILDVCHEADRGTLSAAIKRFVDISGDENPYVLVEWRIILSRKSSGNGTADLDQDCVPVSSSMSINQQGLVIFSMIRGGLSIASPPTTSPQSSLRANRAEKADGVSDGGRIAAARGGEQRFLMPDFNSRCV